MNISAAGLNLIKEFEGFKPRPYRNFPGEPWTIGYGETQGVTSTTGPWSQDYAERKLRARVGRDFESAVERLGVRLNQHQFDALVSFVYNCGVGAIAASTGIGRALRARQWSRAADELMKWNKVNGEPVLGLTRRRRRERALFLKQVASGVRLRVRAAGTHPIAASATTPFSPGPRSHGAARRTLPVCCGPARVRGRPPVRGGRPVGLGEHQLRPA
jgi:lysozyme